jgi:DNA-binding transcriptional LysR family regulator
MNVNLTQIRAFLTVARVKNFTQAAKFLRVSQPALTVQVKQLEDSLSLRLFDRTTRHVSLTRLGSELVPTFQRLLLEFESAVANARELGSKRQGVVRLGCLPSVAKTYLPEIIAEFKKRHPMVSFVLKDANGKRIIAMLRAGEIEFGITDGEANWPDLKITELYHDQMHVVFQKTHPISKLKKITIEDLAKSPMVLLDNESNTRVVLEAAFAAAGRLVTPVCEVSYSSSAIGLVEAGLGITLLGSLAIKSNNLNARSGLHTRPIDDAIFSRHIGLVSRAEHTLSLSSATFIELLLELSQANGWLD